VACPLGDEKVHDCPFVEKIISMEKDIKWIKPLLIPTFLSVLTLVAEVAYLTLLVIGD